ncbi:uncharacterized protein G2W53_006370 [Senna tora]|uniref:Uncharacterized protein n=1 Tax=Senna tora TaxID=362788 RepID=A0A834X439_9FABA|nr:uncharacterized protein G2W53_006370 [Senna tora]
MLPAASHLCAFLIVGRRRQGLVLRRRVETQRKGKLEASFTYSGPPLLQINWGLRFRDLNF